jgi:hypothetical protein
MNLDTTSKKQKEKRCPNGTRKNKKTGNCDPIPVILDSQIELPEQPSASNIQSFSVKPSIDTPAMISNVATEKVVESTNTPAMISNLSSEKGKSNKDKRCPNGTRKNPKTGVCEPINQRVTKKSPPIELPERPSKTPIQKSLPRKSSIEIQKPLENENIEEPVEQADTLINIDSSISGLDKDSNNYLLKKEKLEYDYNATNTDYDFLYPE